MSVIADSRVQSALAEGAVVAFSLSGGKDSMAAAHAAMAWLDQVGHPRADRIAIHADLGRAEWRSTPAQVEATAETLGVPLVVVRHGRHDMVSRWEARFAEGKRRYANLEVFNLIGPWSSANLRFCTAEMKQQVIAPALLRRFPGRTVISVVGIRRAESIGRRNAPVSKPEARWDRANGSRLITWHPIVEWSTDEVFAYHLHQGLALHDAYTVFGSSRVSCAFCIMQSHGDQRAALACNDNWPLYLHLVGIEAGSGFSFQPDRWLGDLARDRLPPELLAALDVGQHKAWVRRTLEAALPSDLRYVKGWPRRVPTAAEAAQIVEAREVILAHHSLPILYPTSASVIERFTELMASNQAVAA